MNTMPHLTLFVDINRTITLVNTVQQKDNETSIAELVAEQCILADGRSYKKMITSQGGSDEENYAAYRKLLTELDSYPRPEYLRMLEAKLRGALAAQEGSVFRSFIVLLENLRAARMSHTVVLRSFGSDTSDVISAIEAAVPGVEFTVQGRFARGKLLVNDCVVSEIQQLSQAPYQSWQDDHPYWKEHGESWEGGKPFPIAKGVNIFLDDNAARKEIIAVRPSIRDHLIESGDVVAVDTVEALLDRSYFWQLIHHRLN